MADETNPGDLFKIKVDGTGAEFAVGNKVPSLIERFLPNSWTSKRKIDSAINENILRKIGADQVLDENELEFLSTICSEHAYRLLRQRSIQAKAMEYISQSPVSALLLEGATDYAQSSNNNNHETSDQWLTRLREDSGGVNSEELSELYSRILAEESLCPNSVSLRTLGVLRYLDSSTLEAFEKLQAVIIDDFAPSYLNNEGADIFDYFDISHEEILMLEDVGLISLAPTSLTFPDSDVIMNARAYGISFVAVRTRPFDTSIKITPLTLAGRELSKISQRVEAFSDLFKIGSWLLTCILQSHKLYYVHEILSKDADTETLNMEEWSIDAE